VRIAWDLQAVTGPRPTGLGVSVRLLLDAFRLHCPDVELRGLPPNLRDAPLRSVLDRVSWEQWRLPRDVARANAAKPLDLLYSPALGAPLRCRVPVVAHVHDLIALRYPEQFSGPAGWYWKRLLPETWRRCRAITVSNASLVDEVSQLLPYPRARIHVVPYYPDPELKPLAANVGDLAGDPAFDLRGDLQRIPANGERFFMTLASYEPRKNIELAIRALGLLKQRGLSARLVCAGLYSPHFERLRRLVSDCGVAELVRFADYLPPWEIVSYLRRATALLFVSRYEGYGMPPQEAQSVGCPVVLSDIACHRAVYADAQRLAMLPPELAVAPPLVGVDDAEALAQQMQRLLQDDAWRALLSRAGLAYCETFSAGATAQALRAAFTAALER